MASREGALKFVGYVPENPIVFENLTAGEFLEFVASLGGSGIVFEERVERYVQLFQLEGHERKKVRELSRGTAQKVLVTAALLHEPLASNGRAYLGDGPRSSVCL